MNSLCTPFLVAAGLMFVTVTALLHAQGWPEWGQNPQHSGAIATVGQSPDRQRARASSTIRSSRASRPYILASCSLHHQAPLTDGQDVFMAFESGEGLRAVRPSGLYTPFPCGSDTVQPGLE